MNDKPQVLPHYEKPDIVLTVEDAKTDFPRIWTQMSELVPNLKNEEKRRIVEIVANSCKHCWVEGSGCKCWDDE